MTDREDAHRSQTKAATDMYQTKNDLPAQTRADVIGIRNARLADSIDLMHQAKQAHWHVKRPSFIVLHKLFDDVVDAAEDSMDLLAERVVQVGGTAEGTIQGATARTGLQASPLTLAEERDHGEARASALPPTARASVKASSRPTPSVTGTRHIFTKISRGVDTYLWSVEAHLG